MADAAPARTTTAPPGYDPERRTAVLFAGTGAAGAYHAGALRALHEAGVKVDLVAGRGMGAAAAVFASIDGGARLWEADGLWRSAEPTGFYRWRRSLRIAGVVCGVVAVLALSPLAPLLIAALVYPLGYLLQLVGVAWGQTLASGYTSVLSMVFDVAAAPTIVPRLVSAGVLVALLCLAVGAASAARAGRRRSSDGPFWSRLVGSPIDARDASHAVVGRLWGLLRGAAQVQQPSAIDVSRRYAELLAENLGQPGFRELLLTAHDLDSRRDVVFALLTEPWRRTFFADRPDHEGEPRAAEAVDLAGAGRDHVVDALSGSLCIAVAADPHLTTFAAESYWRGETHRLCDRPEATVRVLAELALAGVEQLIIVSATPEPAAPFQLQRARVNARARAGEYFAALDGAAVDDALAAYGSRFNAVHCVRPAHAPVGALDFGGVYDERSDRRWPLAEMIDRGYEDAYRLFIDPIVGAGGEGLGRPARRKTKKPGKADAEGS